MKMKFDIIKNSVKFLSNSIFYFIFIISNKLDNEKKQIRMFIHLLLCTEMYSFPYRISNNYKADTTFTFT